MHDITVYIMVDEEERMVIGLKDKTDNQIEDVLEAIGEIMDEVRGEIVE